MKLLKVNCIQLLNFKLNVNLVTAMTALKDDSSAGVMAVVYSVNGINRVLLKISGAVENN